MKGFDIAYLECSVARLGEESRLCAEYELVNVPSSALTDQCKIRVLPICEDTADGSVDGIWE